VGHNRFEKTTSESRQGHATKKREENTQNEKENDDSSLCRLASPAPAGNMTAPSGCLSLTSLAIRRQKEGGKT